EGGTPRNAPASGSDRAPFEEGSEVGGDVVAGDDPQEVPVEAEDERLVPLAQPDRVLGQRLEDRLEIERGPPDHLEQLAGRRLLLERDPQLAVARLQLSEEAHVLDGDDRLIGESPEEGDLFVGERSWSRIHVNVDSAD